MKKDLAIIFGLFLTIAVLVIFGQGLTSISFINPGAGPSARSKSPNITTVAVKTLTVEAKIARTASERKKGLADRQSLPISSAMLFVFENKGRFGFWMKDMKFPIDIIWIDEDRRIVDIAAIVRVQEDKDDDELTIYRPQAEALYALEVNAGLSTLHNLAIGDLVNFEL